jgi:hypothetical protein
LCSYERSLQRGLEVLRWLRRWRERADRRLVKRAPTAAGH